MNTDRCIVVGAGIVGLCTAWSLSKAGWHVTVIDPELPGSQCSFGNAGALSESSVAPLAMPGVALQAFSMLLDSSSPLHVPFDYWLTAAPWFRKFMAAANPERVKYIASAMFGLLAGSVQNHQALAKEAGCSHLVRTTGHLHLYPSQKALRKDKGSWQLKGQYGRTLISVDRQQIEELEPSIHPNYRFGLFIPEDGWISDPYAYSQAIATACALRGVVFEQAQIKSLARAGDTWQLKSDGRRWQTSQVVLTAGMGSRALLQTLGLSVPLETQRGYHLQAPDPGLSLSRIVVLADRKLFINPMQGQLRIAGTVEFGGLARPMNKKRAMHLETHAHAGLTGLNTKGASIWLGHRPCFPDSMPALGPVNNLPGLWCGFGHGHLGLTSSVNTGLLLARSMSGLSTGETLKPFSLNRFV